MSIMMPVTSKISISSSKSVSHRTLVAQFGDGYSQRVPDGINAKVDTWEVDWVNLTKDEMLEIEAALDSVGGHNIILWTPCQENVQKKFILKDGTYKRTQETKFRAFSIKATLVQVYDI